MMFSEEQVEWIVVEVIRRLRLLAEKSPDTGTGVCGSTKCDSTAAELVLKEKLVTLRLLEGRLTGIKRVLVPPRAVVTPAVKDELKARKIQLATSHP